MGHCDTGTGGNDHWGFRWLSHYNSVPVQLLRKAQWVWFCIQHVCAFDSLKWKCSKGHCFPLIEGECLSTVSQLRTMMWCGLWESQSAEGRCWQWHAEDRQPNQGQTLQDIFKLSLNPVHLTWTHCSVLKVSSEPVFPHRCTSLARWAGSWRWTVCVWGSVRGVLRAAGSERGRKDHHLQNVDWGWEHNRGRGLYSRTQVLHSDQLWCVNRFLNPPSLPHPSPFWPEYRICIKLVLFLCVIF